jgi:hypothetical protein
MTSENHQIGNYRKMKGRRQFSRDEAVTPAHTPPREPPETSLSEGEKRIFSSPQPQAGSHQP